MIWTECEEVYKCIADIAEQVDSSTVFCPYCGKRLSGGDAASEYPPNKNGNRQTQKGPLTTAPYTEETVDPRIIQIKTDS